MTPQHTGNSNKAHSGPKLPEKGTYIDERFWLIMPDGHEIMHGWTGERWVTDDAIFLIEDPTDVLNVEDASWIDRPAVVKQEGKPMPLRIFRNML